MTIPDRDHCAALDAADPLAASRARFTLPDGVIYLDGNSLGALPGAVPGRIQTLIADQWGNDLITSWNRHDWIGYPARVGDRIAPLVGARAGEVIVADSTSVNLFKLAAAALRMRPGRRRIVTEKGNFHTDIYILEGLCQQLGEAAELSIVETGGIAAALDETVALVVLTHVHFRTGNILDMARLTEAAHDAGALILWDLSHSAGALPVALDECNVDMAIGCGYKFLNGGPGAPAFAYVAARHQDHIQSPLSGWMGHARPFAFDDHYSPARGIARTLCGTPGVLGMVALDAALDVFDGIDMKAVRQKSVSLGDLFIHLVEERCDGLGLTLACPEISARRGSHVSFSHEQGYAVMQALVRRGVIGDFRAPDVLRFGLTPLYLRYVDIWDAVDILHDILASGSWDQPQFHRRLAVT